MELICISSDEVYLNGHKLDIRQSQKRINHSPTGFSWGYGGSGPAQLALAVMMKMLEGNEEYIKDYQKFKFDVIARLPQKPCSLEMDFTGWLYGKDDYRFEVRELDLPKQEHHNSDTSKCTQGHEAQCAFGKSNDCNCQCRGKNHGKAVQK